MPGVGNFMPDESSGEIIKGLVLKIKGLLVHSRDSFEQERKASSLTHSCGEELVVPAKDFEVAVPKMVRTAIAAETVNMTAGFMISFDWISATMFRKSAA